MIQLLHTLRPSIVRLRVLGAVFLLISTVSLSTSAQMTRGRVALTVAVPQGPDVGMSYVATENIRLNLGLGFSAAVPDSGTSRSNFSVRTGAWYVLPAKDGVALFFGGTVEFGALSGVTSSGDLGLVAQAGAEYAVARSFSVAALIGMGYHSGDTSAAGLPGSRFGTASAAVVLTWWIL